MSKKFDDLVDAERIAYAVAKQPAIEAISARHMPRLRVKMDAVVRNRAQADSAKTRALYDAVAPLTHDLAQHAQCGKGCSHCCHIAVAINQAEAELIGRKTGVKPVKPANRMMEGREKFAHAIPLGYGDPCPFLVDNQCSIYDVRPLACRMHFNLDTSADLCTLDSNRPVLLYGNLEIDKLGIMASGGPYKVVIADIREFFPKGTSHADDQNTD
jgi:Fe-S-cluster containining protein